MAQPGLWSSVISPITLKSFLSSLLRLLYFLSVSTQRNPNHQSTIRNLVDLLCAGEFFSCDAIQFAQLLAIPSHLVDRRSHSNVTHLVAFNSLLIILLDSQLDFGAWLLGDQILQASWPTEDLPPQLAQHFMTLAARMAHHLLPRPLETPLDDIFSAPSSASSSSIKSALSSLISSRIPPNPPKALRTQIVYLYLSFFSDSDDDSQQLKVAKQFVADAFLADKPCVVDAVRLANKELEIGALVSAMRMCLLGLKEEVSAGIANSCLASFFEVTVSFLLQFKPSGLMFCPLPANPTGIHHATSTIVNPPPAPRRLSTPHRLFQTNLHPFLLLQPKFSCDSQVSLRPSGSNVVSS